MKEIRANNENCVQDISTKDVLEWFKSVDDKKNRKFINASITPELLEESVDWDTEFVDISA